MEKLNEKEKIILNLIVEQFIATANPVGSQQISDQAGVQLKPASVRRIMARLEEKGYVIQPHTSAGRIPTTTGYRFYVDQLIRPIRMRPQEMRTIQETLKTYDGDIEQLLQRVTRMLAEISHQLGIGVTPKFYESIFEKIELVPISSDKIMSIIMVKEGQVKSFIIETKQNMPQADLKKVKDKINQRFHGQTLKEIKHSFANVMADLRNEKTGLVRLFTEMADRMFDFSRYENYTLNGTRNILTQPEFTDVQRFSMLINLLENKNIIIHFMGKREYPPGIRVTIGNEHAEKEMQNCSVITSTYRIGEVSGVLGVIGPMRMAYRKMIPLVDFTANAVTNKLNVA